MSKSNSSLIFNLLTLVFLLGTCVSLMVVAAIFINPYILPEPFQPATQMALVPTLTRLPTLPPSNTPEFTATPLNPTLPPSWTPKVTPTPSITPTGAEPTEKPTKTSFPTFTYTPTFSPTPTRTATPTATGPTPTASRTQSAYSFTLQNEKPAYILNWANSAGCAWMGIAGQAFNMAEQPIQGYYVRLEGGGLSFDAITGSKTAYGLGGYELYITDHVIETTNTYKVQLRDATGKALSDWYYVSTFADCAKNLIMVNFVQNH